MNQHTHANRNHAFLALALLCIALAIVWLALLPGRQEEYSFPAQFSGAWAITDDAGNSLGTINLSADGKFDDGEYVGRWTLQEGGIHVRTWEGKPSSWRARVIPDVDEIVLLPHYDATTNRWTLKNEHVTLTRVSGKK